MEIRLLKRGYKNNEKIYQNFLKDNLKKFGEYFSNDPEDLLIIDYAPSFPIYIATKNEEERKKSFIEAFKTISEHYLKTDREIHMNERFWHTLLVTEKREYILDKYSEVKHSYSKFKNIVFKNFNWENYIYKSVIAAQYINDYVKDKDKREYYFDLITENLDLFNYIIKYPIFRNGDFFIKILDIINKYNLSNLMKKTITNSPDLGKDERYGRRVIFEFNKSYPVIMSPMIERSELEKLFFEYLSYYYDDVKTLKKAL
jgi:hypothetical protein